VSRFTGRRLVVAELATEYGFTDVDGARPSSVRSFFASRSGGASASGEESGPG
jgi:hypothetical protein